MITAREALKKQQAVRKAAEKERERRITAELEKIDRAVTDLAERGFRKLEYTVTNEKLIEPVLFRLQATDLGFIARKTHSTGINVEW